MKTYTEQDMGFKVFEFDLIENRFIIGFDYKDTGKRYLNGTFCVASNVPQGILILTLNNGLSDSEPINVSILDLFPDETEAIKSNINKYINSVSDEDVLKDINNFFKAKRHESKSN